jgi:oligopeptide transport system ATP-binding protein
MIEVAGLVKHYRIGRRVIRAVDGVSFTVGSGQTLGLVGESGCGKSTLARLLVRLETATAGRIVIGGDDVTSLRGARLRELRGRVQLVFQDPATALNPRLTVGDALGEVLWVHGRRIRDGRAGRDREGGGTGRGGARRDRGGLGRRIGELLEMVGLPAGVAGLHPHALSGGQRQRVGIARALAVSPEALILDEPVSALDLSVRAEIVNLLVRLRDELRLTYVFISHDLGLVRHVADRIAVMYLGQIVELGDWQQVSDRPRHPYARSLQAAVPVIPAQDSVAAESPRGEPPDPAAPPSGCRFHTRCPIAEPECRTRVPPLVAVGPGHYAACPVSR